MPIQADPPFIDSVKAQEYRARLRAIYKAPSAIRPQVFNVQQPLPPVPYTNSPNFPSYLDAQIKANPAPPQPPPRNVPPLPPPTTPVTLPPTTNPVPRIAPPSGGGAAVVTLTGGGIITGAGLLTGGLSLLAGGLLVYNARELFKLFKLSQPEAKFKAPELRGGQDPNTLYTISGTVTEIATPIKGITGYWAFLSFIDSVEITWTFNKVVPSPGDGDPQGFNGPITITSKVGDEIPYQTSTANVGIEHRLDKKRTRMSPGEFELKGADSLSELDKKNNFGVPFYSNRIITSIDLVAIPVGQEKPDQILPQQRQSLIKSGTTPSPTPQGISSPSPAGVRSPNSPPPVVTPLPTNNRIPYTIVTPGAAPITITSPGAAPITISPAGSPATIKITRPSASPFLSPTPAATPTTTPAGVPIAVSSPNAPPTNLIMPGSNPITITYPGQEPIVIDPKTPGKPTGVQAAPIPKTGFITTPVSPNQTPTNPATTPTAPTKPGTPTAPTIPGIEEPSTNDILLKLVGLTALIQGVNNNTTPTAIQNAVGPAIAPAVCSTTAPGGCSSNMTNNAVGKGVNDLKDFLKKNGLDAAAQVEQLRLLNQLDGKMGAQMPGGLAGAFGRLSKFLGVDRIFNLINFMANLHNAFMLSNSLKITLLEMLSSVGNATGLLQSSENENVDLNEVYNQGVRALINSVLGDEQAARLEIQFRRANRIYQATTNSLNAVSGMMSSLGNVIEVSAEYGGKIGNALKAAGAVHEKAYQWMAEKFDAKISPFMKYSQTVNGVNTALETINEIAESVVEGQQAATEFQKANTDFLNAVAEVKKNPGVENKAVAAEVAKQKENATKDPTGEDETGLLSFLTDL